jgi:hypothetical protein
MEAATKATITANEFRLGNWIRFVNSNGAEMNLQINVYLLGYMTEASPDYMQHGYGIKYEVGSISGIPLTPEILEKCGFTKQPYYLDPIISCYNLSLENVMKAKDKFEMIGHVVNDPVEGYEQGHCSVRFSVNGIWASDELMYLHQVQNLYFALTGTELAVNL